MGRVRMGKLAALWRIASTWYVSLVIFAALGIVLGYFVFFKVFPGKPQIGVIDIPFTVITDDSAFVIGAYLDYVRRTDSIKAAVIRLNSPGGGAAASELLYTETRKLRDQKPVVIVMSDIVASGGFMMAMGATHTYTKGSSIVGNVGVILFFPGPVLPFAPDEDLIVTGPSKLTGGSRRDWITLLDGLKSGFAQIVITERGDKLRLSREELMTGRLFSGIEAVQKGLVDDIGSDTEAIEKAASLSGISSYGLVDVNVEVQRLFVQKFRRIFESLEGTEVPFNLASAPAHQSSPRGTTDSPLPMSSVGALGGVTNMEALRRLFLSQSAGENPQDALPGFPLKVGRPNIYYLYVGTSE
jgi:protease-4